MRLHNMLGGRPKLLPANRTSPACRREDAMTETKPDTSIEHRAWLRRALELAIDEAWRAGTSDRISIGVQHFMRELEFEDRCTIKSGDMEIVAPSK
jgi:hypothetical protein